MAAVLQEVLTAYIEAWCEPEPERRTQLLAQSWHEDGVYKDPQMEAEGRAALSDYIGTVHERMPGASLAYTSGVNRHHDHIYFSWHLAAGDGKVVLKGVDFGTLADDGRLRQIVGFFGDLPAL
ncbi:nuclear transport factor 2 family protein [Hwanghaeella grinnelliae]|uniref:Nuclear transport factor 2 family protein n=1 Tax=Hwanghaeella grinnelliae TaxID=2500179 RepID=A0A437QJX7_9PROT|nr:nuclear transport factor 2 family protein [Hwanghaeella grinnelliae]RVU34816.1 nuclear transport factor 2 family protein [Hwanghaeella grinnelliae]